MHDVIKRKTPDILADAEVFLAELEEGGINVETTDTATLQMLQQVYRQTHGHCAYCGALLKLKNMAVSYIVPLSLGGDNALHNMLPSCRPCFRFRGSLEILQFKDSVREAIKKNEKLRKRFAGVTLFNNRNPSIVSTNGVTFYFESRNMLDDRQKVLQAKKSEEMRRKEQIYNKTNGHCAYCGVKLKIKDMTIEHIVPQSRAYGGKGGSSNLLAACFYCNNNKTDLTLEEYRESVKKAISEGTHEQHRNIMSFQSKGSNTLRFYFECLNIYAPRDTGDIFESSWQEKGRVVT